MKSFIISIILIFAFILQTTVIQYIELWNVKPNLIIIIIISFAILRGGVVGAVVGLFSGILLDVFTARVFGLHSILGMYTGMLAGIFSSRFVRESYFVAVIFTFTLSFTYELVFFLLRFFIWEETQFLIFINNNILPQAIYNSMLVIPVYYYIIRINRYLDRNLDEARKY